MDNYSGSMVLHFLFESLNVQIITWNFKEEDLFQNDCIFAAGAIQK